MLSRSAIRPTLRLPGFLGSLIGESLRIFERLTEWGCPITGRGLIEGIDGLLLELSAEQEAGNMLAGPDPAEPERTLPGMLLLAAAAFLVVFAAFLPKGIPAFPD